MKRSSKFLKKIMKLIIKIFLLFFILLILFILQIIYYRNKNYMGCNQGDNTNKVFILLTMCYRSGNLKDEKYKKDLYDSCIREWAKKDIPIFIVESSRSPYPLYIADQSENIHVCSIDIETNGSSTNMEARSILHALEYFKDHLTQYTHVIKISGRYFIPKIINHLNFPSDTYFIFQHRNDPLIQWQNSEIFGCKKEIAFDIFNKISNGNDLMEIELYNLYNSNKNRFKWTRLPPFENHNNVKRGGDGLVVNPL